MLKAKRIRLPKVGEVKCVVHRQIIGTIKTVTVLKTACGHYYASVLADDGVPLPPVSTEGKVLGVDVGLIDFAVTSEGQHFENPRHLKRVEKNPKRKQRALSRKQKGSNKRAKTRRLVARVHERVWNIRRDYLHKVSRRLVNENQVLAVEDLNVKGMVRNPNLAKAISEVGWGIFMRFGQYKSQWEGKGFVRTNRFFPSSKTCHACGTIHEGMDLSTRVWVCRGCQRVHERDENAACNIRDEAIRMIRAGGTPAPASGMGAAARGGKVGRGRGRKSSVHALALEAGSPAL